jgi:hypothetical protein
MIIYLDESGDLGFSFNEGKRPSNYFVTTLLVCQSDKASKAIQYAIAKTLRNKINRSPKKITYEIKGAKKREEFNTYLFNHLESLLPLNVSLYINHDRSHLNKGIQAVDLFCWGIFRKYEYKDLDWYNVFADRIKLELTSGIKKDGPSYVNS